jgi:hypothetical protein
VLWIGIVRFDADPEPNFHVDADPDQDSDPDWHQYDNTMPILRRILPQVLHV